MTDLLAPIVLVLIKSNPRGLKSLASLIRDDPKPEEGDEPPALTAGLVVKGEALGTCRLRRKSDINDRCRLTSACAPQNLIQSVLFPLLDVMNQGRMMSAWPGGRRRSWGSSAARTTPRSRNIERQVSPVSLTCSVYVELYFATSLESVHPISHRLSLWINKLVAVGACRSRRSADTQLLQAISRSVFYPYHHPHNLLLSCVGRRGAT